MSLWPRSPAWDDPFFRDTFGRFDRSMFPYWMNADRSVLSVANETQQVINNDQKFAVSLDVSQFRPEELRVQLQGRELVIEGKQENKGDGNYMERSFVRKWTLPPDVDIEGIRSDLNNVGHLSVEAPKTGRQLDSVRTIPIQQAPVHH